MHCTHYETGTRGPINRTPARRGAALTEPTQYELLVYMAHAPSHIQSLQPAEAFIKGVGLILGHVGAYDSPSPIRLVSGITYDNPAHARKEAIQEFLSCASGY